MVTVVNGQKNQNAKGKNQKAKGKSGDLMSPRY
jgi:hypothetical protein